MAAASRRRRSNLEAWPGYVDVLSTLLMVIVFVLMIFVVAQLYLSQALSGKDESLAKLSKQLSELSDMLSMERGTSQQLKVQLSQLSAGLTKSTKERDALQNQLTVVIGDRDALKAQLSDAQAQVAANADANQERDKRLADLQLQIAQAQAVSKDQEQKLEDAYKTMDADKEKLTALLSNIQELESLRDDLQKKLLTSDENAKQITSQSEAQGRPLEPADPGHARAAGADLGGARKPPSRKARSSRSRSSISAPSSTRRSPPRSRSWRATARNFSAACVKRWATARTSGSSGDRFVFSVGSAVRFRLGGYRPRPAATSWTRWRTTLILIMNEIPSDINWVLRVDGHTDKRPITSGLYPSNWELSTARAIAVVKVSRQQGHPRGSPRRRRLRRVQPPSTRRTTRTAYTKNRRIEFKLDQR